MSIKSTDDWRSAVTWMILPAGRAWQRKAAAAITRPGLSLPAAASLLVIARLGDGIRQMEVAEEAVIDRAAIARSVSLLEKSGYLTRRADPADARAKVLYLTSKGRDLAAVLEADLIDMRASVLAGISDADGEAAVRVLLALEMSRTRD